MQLHYHFLKYGKEIKDIKIFYPQDIRKVFNNIIFQKQSPLAPIFSHSLLKLHEEGLIRKAVRSYTGTRGKVLDQNDAFEVLSIGQCLLGFVILGSGILIMIWILLIECCFAKCRCHSRDSLKNKQNILESFKDTCVNGGILLPPSLLPKRR